MKAILVFLFGLLICASANGFISIGTVSEAGAGIYNAPKGKKLGELAVGEQVQVVGGRNGWYEVFTRVPGKAEPGNFWVNGAQIDIGNNELQRAYDHRYEDIHGDHCANDEDSGAMACLTVRDMGMECQELWYGEGYEKCLIKYDLSVESNYRGAQTLSVSTECTAKVVKNGYAFAASNESVWEIVRFDEPGEKWVSVEKKLNFDSLDPINEVELKEAQCKVSWAREMPR